MKIIKLSVICAAVILLMTSAAYMTRKRPIDAKLPDKPQKGIAVLELFTSEGCSSCPPAEELLERMQKETEGKRVYIMAYHVDYWDRLGWKDKFSDAVFSKRQYWYNSKFTSQVYTPQLIVNGTHEFVGSDEESIRRSINEAVSLPEPYPISVNAHQEAGVISIDYQLKDKPANAQLLIAVVQKHAATNVKTGENEGKTLSHVQIVRSIHTFNIPQQGAAGHQSIAAMAASNPQELEVICLIQNSLTGEIINAARASIK